MENKKVELFLDSGAFSAWTQKTEINIQEYISFIKKHKELIDIYANLDAIPVKSANNTSINAGSVDSAEATLKNQRIMEEAGLSPIPVFHFGEPEEYLEFYVEKYDYIAIGGIAKIRPLQLYSWLDELFANYICDSKGMPKVKVHGFAVTSLRLMTRYPWYSVDSTSWVVTGRMGSIFVPRRSNKKWVYDENSWKVSVSTQSPNKKEAGQHFDTMTPIEQKLVLDYLHDKGYELGKSEFKVVNQSYELAENERFVGKKPAKKDEMRKVEVLLEEGVANKYQHRDEINIIYFLDLEASLPDYPWAFKKKSHSLF